MKVHPKDFFKLVPGQACFVSGIPAKLIYAQARKNFFYDDKGNLTKEFEMVAHRCGYVPDSGLHDGRTVDSVHCSVGLFTIEV
ncbi:MAG: hypothetical protein JWO15_3577 [Sphingomonadales bacterium]|nr:hypothetical protein [Sphingomonadales bacterium]